MRRSRALFMLAVALLWHPAQAAAEGIEFDGAWWQSLNNHDQLMAVKGMIAALDLATCSSGQPVLEMRSASFVCPNWSDGKKQEHLAFSKTFGVYIDEITDFYTRHPKRLMAPMPAELLKDCFADDPEISHLPPGSTVSSCDDVGSAQDAK